MSQQVVTKKPALSRLPGSRPSKFLPYLIPGLVALLVIVIVPFGWNIYLSLTRWRGVGPVKFVGFANWQRLMADATFWKSFLNSFWIIVAIVVIPTALGLLISSVLTDVIQKKFGSGNASFIRALYYLPQLLPVAVASVIMGWIFRPDDGAVNDLLEKIGLGSLQHNWLGDADSALPILMVILIWIQLGYPIVIFMSGLQRVDPELYEAASLDGANWWQKFRVVTLPSIVPELLVVILTATIGALKTFGPVYLLTKGGPGTTTIVPSYYSYNQFFQLHQVGYGAAISTALTLVIIVFSVIFTIIQGRVEKNAA
ncbi:ABC transporter permease [Bifidobacterium aemilianum]|uniref:ABC transporter permease n=1 Tax=Bifidobacterium aemilianum TaxID=2493120 RepID=A0A366K860_9BIFI|nr:sugar ABC transporter permease [Bifidobacterium aemilianum]RBP97348.1 ABC transporter permease [Bifidobacterium aemilianum]